MKRTDENRYPHSAELFKFCKEALNIKHAYEVKVIDQHVGAILGFDPADCSHWKKGKKNIKSLETIKTIAQHLDTDEREIFDIIAGRSDIEEALHEYRGYGQCGLTPKQIDDLKREYFRNSARFQNELGVQSFEQLVDVQRSLTESRAEGLLLRAGVNSLPVMLPEIVEILDGAVVIQTGQADQTPAIKVEYRNDQCIITHQNVMMKPFLRFLIAREIGRQVLFGNRTLPEITSVIDVRLNIFASALLIPPVLLQGALRFSDPTTDLIEQLSVLFWVPRSIISARVRDFIVR